MPDSAFEELGSHRPPSAYDGTLHRPCSHCGAAVDELCTMEVLELQNRKPVKMVQFRHHPCVSRLREAS